MKVAVIGDGGWGTTLSILLFNKGNAVNMWSPVPGYAEVLRSERKNPKFLPDVNIPDALLISSKMEEVLEGAELVVLAVPSLYVRDTAGKAKPHLPPGALVVSVVKGIEENTLSISAEGTISESYSTRALLTQLQGQLTETSMIGVSSVRWETLVVLKHWQPTPAMRLEVNDQLAFAQ